MKFRSLWASIIIGSILSSGCTVTTPKFTEKDITGRMALDREAMFKGQEPLKMPITLEEAMARAIKYNIDHRLKIMESALSMRQVDLATFDMLPRLVAAAGYTERDSYNASSSMNVATGQQSLAPSTSQDKGHVNTDLTLTWNILDFGVSYFQAKQQADRAHIMKERRRKVVHSIMQQIRQEFWLALGAQQLETRFSVLLMDVEKALQDTTNIEQEKLRPPIETLTYRKTLLEIIKQLETFRDELAQAKPRLASLMNLPLGQSFSVVPPSSLIIPKGPDAIQYLEIRALLQRPELNEADYNERISMYETKKAIARMFPGIELSVGGHYDGNSFMVNQQWVEGGARLTWNLMNLISGPSQYKIAKSQVEISKAQRLALSVAILTQVHVSYQNFYSRKRQFELSGQLQDIDSRIHEQTMNQAKSGSQNHLNEIRSATAALMAEYRSYQNYASLQSACGQIIATLGDEPLPETVTSYEIKDLSTVISARLNAPGALCTPSPDAGALVIKPSPAKAIPVVPVVVAAPVIPTNQSSQTSQTSTVHAVPAAPVIPVIPVVVADVVKQAQPVISLSLSPNTIAKGQKATLAWDAKNATKCEIMPGVGTVKPQGNQDISPAETTRYTVTCEGDGGTSIGAATLAVVPVKVVTAQPGAAVSATSTSMMFSLEFDSGESDIKPEHYYKLKKLADFLKECPDVRGDILGHTDNVLYSEGDMSNLKLSRQRAENIRTYLIITYGIDPKRITSKGFGSKRPVADNRTEEGRRKNRRIETNFRCEDKK